MTRAEVLLDTDILSAIMRGEPAALSHVRDYVAAYPRLTISIITRYEILRGLKAKRAMAQLKKFEVLCASLQVLTSLGRTLQVLVALQQPRVIMGAARRSVQT